MPERDGTAIGVHMIRVVRQPQVTQDRESLRRKRFVQLDDVDLGKSQPEPLQ